MVRSCRCPKATMLVALLTPSEGEIDASRQGLDLGRRQVPVEQQDRFRGPAGDGLSLGSGELRGSVLGCDAPPSRYSCHVHVKVVFSPAARRSPANSSLCKAAGAMFTRLIIGLAEIRQLLAFKNTSFGSVLIRRRRVSRAEKGTGCIEMPPPGPVPCV